MPDRARRELPRFDIYKEFRQGCIYHKGCIAGNARSWCNDVATECNDWGTIPPKREDPEPSSPDLRNKKIAENPELAKYGVYNTKEELLDRLKQGKTITSSNSTEPSSSSGRGKLMSLPAKTNLSSSEVTSLQQGLNDLIDAGYLSGPKLAEDGVKGTNTNNKLRALQGLIGATVDGDWGPNTYEALRRSKFTAFKTGGLADFTGPAWLDGTKSKPELVLNARDTENFLVLKDVLASLLHLPTSTSSNGDNFFDINIQVDEIADDYDVDQVVERVKQKIYEDSMYRNNNMINLLR